MASSTVAVQSQPSASAKFPNCAEFRATSIRQDFSIPESIVYYMIQNPPSAEVYQKLIESCKYFFPKNPILIYHCLFFEENEWRTCIGEDCSGSSKNWKYRKIDLDFYRIRSKIWVTCHLLISSSNRDLAASLVSKLYNGNIKYLTLRVQNISFTDCLFFSLKVKKLMLYETYVFNENGAEVLYENILSSLPMVQCFGFTCINTLYDFSNTVAELLKIPHFKSLKYFIGFNVSESFDIETFFDYLKKNKTTAAWLVFRGQLSEEYKEKLEAIVDEVLFAESPRAYIPPYIYFRGQLRIKEGALLKLCRTYHKLFLFYCCFLFS